MKLTIIRNKYFILLFYYKYSSQNTWNYFFGSKITSNIWIYAIPACICILSSESLLCKIHCLAKMFEFYFEKMCSMYICIYIIFLSKCIFIFRENYYHYSQNHNNLIKPNLNMVLKEFLSTSHLVVSHFLAPRCK